MDEGKNILNVSLTVKLKNRAEARHVMYDPGTFSTDTVTGKCDNSQVMHDPGIVIVW